MKAHISIYLNSSFYIRWHVSFIDRYIIFLFKLPIKKYHVDLRLIY